MSRCSNHTTKVIKLSCIYDRYIITLSYHDVSKSDLFLESDFDDVIKTIKYISNDTPALPLESIIPPSDRLSKTLDTLHQICDKFNRCVSTIRFLEKGTSLPAKRNSKTPSQELCHHIYHLCYKKAIKNPKLLNKYEPFSSEVYGETDFDFICSLLDQLPIDENDVFLDLGSGIGNVVMLVAALSSCKLAVGIEKNIYPSMYADTFSKYFKMWMRWFGKKDVNVELIHDDFLSDASQEMIRKASVIFVNNYAFGAEVNHQLALRFQDLNEGVRIVSPLPFCPEKFRVTDRSLNNIASMMRIEMIPPLRGPVSWTARDIQYYIHTIDRTKLENYYFLKGDATIVQLQPDETNSGILALPRNRTELKMETETETETSSDSNTYENPGRLDIDVGYQIERSLSNLLKTYEGQFLDLIDSMKQDWFRKYVESLIEKERQKRKSLLNRINCLERLVSDLESEHDRLQHNNWNQIWNEIANYCPEDETKG